MDIIEKTLTDVDNLSDDKCREYLAALSKGLAHPARVEIIRKLANKDRQTRCICSDIVKILPLAQSSVSQHLKILKDSGWIEDKVEGVSVCYCLKEGVMDYYEALLQRCVGKEEAFLTSRAG
jgi:DNA-binding transcriptional ArsR family regulator